MTSPSLLTSPDNPRAWPALLAAACLGALGIALASQYWGGLHPCVLCIYQRYAYGAALIAAGLAFAMAPNAAARKVTLFASALAFLAGAGLAGFHVGVEQQWWEGLEACSNPGLPADASLEELRAAILNQPFAPCDAVPWSLFGISIAGYNLLASLVLAGLAFWAAFGHAAAAKRSPSA